MIGGGISATQSGLPLTVSGGAGGPNRECNGQNATGRPSGTAAASVPTGAGLVNFDFSACKTFRVTAGKRVEIRPERLNTFNRAQFLNPPAAVNTGTTGRPINAKPSRWMQMALKFVFRRAKAFGVRRSALGGASRKSEHR